jgi:tetratricopeptide (TPR) repeat protein
MNAQMNVPQNILMIIRTIGMVVLLACVLSPAWGAPAADTEAKSLYDEGVELNKQRRYDEAIEKFTRAVTASLDTHQYHQTLVMTYIATSHGPQAIRWYQELAAAHPKNAVVHYWLGRLYLQRQSMDDAIREFQEAGRLAPNDEHAFISLGHVYLRVGKDAEAVNAYRQADRLSPHVAPVHAGLGTIYFNRKDYPGAQKEYEEALKIDPSLTEARYNLSLIYEKKGQLTKAMQQWQKLLDDDPNESQARERLARAYFAGKRYRDAAREYTTLSEVKQNSPEVFLSLGESLVLSAAADGDQGERTQLRELALQAFQRTLELDPKNAPARRYLDRLTAPAPPHEHP